MKEKMTNNWGLKLIAIASAILIWMVIMNTTDPVTKFTVSGIPIEFLNEENAIIENDMVYEVVGSRTVAVEVTTRTVDKGKITKDDFRATVDLNEIYGVTGNVKINVQMVGEDASLVWEWEQKSMYVHIKTENVISKTFTIEAVQEGQIEDGYVYRQCTLSSDTVTLRAPESQIAKVHSVKAIVDVSQSLNDEQVPVQLTYYDANGKELNISRLEIEADREMVDAHIVVQKTSPVSIDVVVKNKEKVADGYRYITYRISEQSISVIGSKQSVAGLDKIQIEMDATGADANVEKQIDLQEYLPENVTVAGGNTIVKVTLVIEPEGTLVLNVPVASIVLLHKNEEMKYALSGNDVVVEIFGLVSDWEGLKASDIKLSIDVSELEEGEYSLSPEIKNIDGLKLTVSEPVALKVELINPPTEEPTEESTAESDEESTEESTDGDSEQVSGTEADEEIGTEKRNGKRNS
ncbi:MAG: hypothetical protein IJN46_06375 [Lachnospiraceae bacterium]|nr:hypothetical protein [Lachnospiraceae bacterium]